MRVFVDTSFLIPAFVEEHPNHQRTLPWIRKILRKNVVAGLSSHSIAEAYSVLTTIPVLPRISPSAANQMISKNLLSRFDIIELTSDDYCQAIRLAGERELTGGVIFDVLIGIGFERFNADVLLTFNIRDFIRIFPDRENCIQSP